MLLDHTLAVEAAAAAALRPRRLAAVAARVAAARAAAHILANLGGSYDLGGAKLKIDQIRRRALLHHHTRLAPLDALARVAAVRRVQPQRHLP